MHFGAQLLQPLLVRDAEMLLLVDDDQAEILELDGLAEQRMRADDDVDRAVGDALLALRQARSPRRAARPARPAAGSRGSARAKVLMCWRASSVVGTTTATCLPFIAATKAARSATSVLPKPTSPQISRSIGRPDAKILEHGVDGGLLILGFLVGEAGAEFVVEARRRPSAAAPRAICRAAAILISSPAISRMRFFIRALRACQAAAAEPVELGAGLSEP